MSVSVAHSDALAISREQAAEVLGVSLDTLERHVLPHVHTVRVGRRVLVPTVALEAFLASTEAE